MRSIHTLDLFVVCEVGLRFVDSHDWVFVTLQEDHTLVKMYVVRMNDSTYL